jgi:hypothetical protein
MKKQSSSESAGERAAQGEPKNDNTKSGFRGAALLTNPHSI